MGENREIKYIGFYNLSNKKYDRVGVLAATNKMDYISEVLNEIGYKVHFVSPSWFNNSNQKPKWTRQQTIKLDDKKKITFVPSFITRRKWTRNIKIILTLLWLFFWLIVNVKKDEKIIFYHAPWLILPILWAKKIKRFKLVLEVEEIYSDVSSLHPYFDTLEQKIFKNADAFIFSTELLMKRINTNKKYTVVYGNYKVENKIAEPINDGKIHLLYAGIIDTYKLGAFNAVDSAMFLDDNYILHIIGFGNVDLLQKRIEEISKKTTCKIVFDGSKKGKEYVEYVQRCHIGLSTMKLNGEFTETSFPSKLISYLRLGLLVVSGDVVSVKKSKIKDYVYFYDKDNPKNIAETIKRIDINRWENESNVLIDLHESFLKDLKYIINE